jgi:hypothetical protein
MIDNVITVEGLFTYVLFTAIIKNEDNQVEYKFMTNSDGTNTAKTPIGCFSELLIDNDLNFVVNTINAYNDDGE